VSSNNNQTRYDFTVGFTKNATGAESSGSFTLWGESGVDDTTALALLSALRGVATPAGTSAQIGVQKTDVNQISYVTDLAAVPPVFV
jgi:hypothetical protein